MLAGSPFIGTVGDQEPDFFFATVLFRLCGEEDKSVRQCEEGRRRLSAKAEVSRVVDDRPSARARKYPGETEVDEMGRWADVAWDRI